MNRNQESELMIDTSSSLRDYEADHLDTAFIRGKRSDLGMLDQQIKLANLSKNLEMSNKYPDFGFKYEHMNAFGAFPNAFSLMGTLSIPIVPWASKEYKAKAIFYDHSINALQNQKTALLNEAVSKANLLFNTMASLKAEIKMYGRKIIPAAEDYYKTSMLAYEQNSEDLEAVLMAINKYQMVKSDYLEKLSDLMQMQAEYEKELEIK